MGKLTMSLETSIDGVWVAPLKVISAFGGDVMHGMKASYFSFVETGMIKAWKRHREMTLNLVVPVGAIRFVLYDDRPQTQGNHRFQEVVLSKQNYCRLTVPPMVWMGFQGLGQVNSMLLNVASIEHSPSEMDRKEISSIQFNWEAVE